MSIKDFLIHNWVSILYINFKMLPFKQALHLPIDIYGRVKVLNLTGAVKIEGKATTGMIKLGSQGRDMFPHHPVVLDIRGMLIFHGSFYCGVGTCIRIEENAQLDIGARTRFGANSLLFCQKRIMIGSEVEGSWNVQIMDTDRHQILDLNTNKKVLMDKSISIGNKVWICNNVNINKGTIIPDDTIIASKSLLNKNYSTIPKYSVIGGCPGKCISTNKKRIWD